MSIPLGELAALGTAVCWTASSLAFTAAARRVGALALNPIRLIFALAFLTPFCWIRRGTPLPLDAGADVWSWLTVSGLVGFVVGDLALFRAFVLVGPRTAMLVMSLVPPIAALLGWLWLGERLGLADLAGMAVTLGGVAWVVMERQPQQQGEGAAPVPRTTGEGFGLALLGALGQAVGLVLSKLGMQGYDPFASTQIRILAALAGYAVIFAAIRAWGRVFTALKDRPGMAYAAAGAVAGPFLGVSLSLLAVQHTQTGVAATIMSTTPVLIIPAVLVLRLERVSPRAALGAAVAVGGVALLWLR